MERDVLKVHHLSNSRSQRILWLVEELGVPYELVKHMRDPVTVRSPPSLFKIHPLGKGPTIEHDGKALTESGAIIDYVTRRVAGGKLSVPESSPEFADYCFWLHYAEGSASSSTQVMVMSASDKPLSSRNSCFESTSER